MAKKLTRESFFMTNRLVPLLKCTVCAVRTKNILPYERIKIWAFIVMALMGFALKSNDPQCK